MARRFLPLVATFLFPHLDFQKQKVRMSTCTKLAIAALLTEHKYCMKAVLLSDTGSHRLAR